jgi:hypothetical protein
MTAREFREKMHQLKLGDRRMAYIIMGRWEKVEAWRQDREDIPGYMPMFLRALEIPGVLEAVEETADIYHGPPQKKRNDR